MNKLVALPVAVAAALPVSSPAIANEALPSISASADVSPTAALKRAEEMVDILRTCFVRQDWKVDQVAAERALAYCRANAANGADPDDEREAAFDFFSSHGQSLDWVLLGRHDVMICGLAAKSERANGLAAAASGVIDPIFAAIEAHRAAYAEFQHGHHDDQESDDALTKADQLANALLAVEPTTIDGAAGLLAYYAECTIEDDTRFSDSELNREDRNGVPFAAALTRLASRAISKIRAQTVFA